MQNEYLDSIKENVIEARYDKDPIIEKHLPKNQHLLKVVNFINQNMPTTIEQLTNEQYSTVFKCMWQKEQGIIYDYMIPQNKDLEDTVAVFKEISKDKNRLYKHLEIEDLKQLCIIHNAIRFKQDRALYLKRYSNEDNI